MSLEELGKELLTELDNIKTWFSAGSNKNLRVSALADKVAEAIGGRPDATPADASQPAPGPGVKTPVEVDSVGQLADSAGPADKGQVPADAVAKANKAGEQVAP